MSPPRVDPSQGQTAPRSRRKGGRPLRMCRWLMLSVALPALAQAAPPSFELDRDPQKLVVVFDEEIGAIAEPDPIPRLRIYAGGLARVHVPRYMKGSGDYSLRLDPLRLRALVRELISAGMMNLDDRQIRRHRRTLGTRRDSAGRPRRRTDPGTVRVEIRLARFGGKGAARRQLRWPGLRGDARDFPGDLRVRDMKRAVDALWRICHDPELRPDPGTSR